MVEQVFVSLVDLQGDHVLIEHEMVHFGAVLVAITKHAGNHIGLIDLNHHVRGINRLQAEIFLKLLCDLGGG